MSAQENELARWTVSLRGHALRMAVIIGTTPLILSPFLVVGAFLYGAAWDSLAQWALALPFAALLTWVLGDFGLYRQHRGSEWVLTQKALYIRERDTDPVTLPLGDIKRINRFPLWSLVLRLRNGLAVTLPLPPTPRDLRQQILAARDALGGQAT